MGGGPVAAARRSDVLIIYSWTFLYVPNAHMLLFLLIEPPHDFLHR